MSAPLRPSYESELEARVAALEAENGSLNGQVDRDSQTIIKFGLRIAELEAEVASLTAIHDRSNS